MKNKKYYLLSFIIPGILMILLYLSVGVIGGNKNILTVDLANQYIEFFSALKNILTGTISPYYSFSKTLGGNLFGLITYYLMSPYNILVVFFDIIDLPKFVLTINVLKIASAGLTSYIYFSKKNQNNKTALTFSIIYALMAYNIVYSQNIMWLDGVILLPIVFRGIDKLLEDKPNLFYITLTITIITNYYIGYMTCISSLMYYIYENYLKTKKTELKKILICIKYILISVLTSSIVLIPSIFSLMQGKANGMIGEFIPNQRFALIDLLQRFYIGTFKNGDLLGTLPNIYISLFAIVLAIYYFYNQNIDKKEKKASAILLLAFSLGFIFSPINTIWHTLKNPVGFPFRYSFMFDMIILIIARKSLDNINKIENDFLKKFITYGLIITLFIDKMLYNSSAYYKIIGTFILAIIYLLYLKNKNKKTLSPLIILMITGEMFLNSFVIVYNIRYQNKNIYSDFIKETGTIINQIKKQDQTFYRLEKDYSYSSNDALLLNYNGISHFSSVYESQNNEFLGKYLGIFNRFYITNYNGSTLVTNSLLNIKYILSKEEQPYYDKLEKNNNIYTYQNNYNLPLGFLVNQNIKKIELKENKPFENQNNILTTMDENIKNVFTENNYEIKLNNVKYDEYEKAYKKINDAYKASLKIKINKQEEGITYGYIYGKEFRKIDILQNGKSIIDVTDENNYKYNIINLGTENGPIEIEIVLLDYKFKPQEISFYTLEIEKFDKAIEILNKKEQLNIKEINNTTIKATIEAKNNHTLYTSIPYDKGFNAYIDNQKVKIDKCLNTFMCLDIEKGNHEIEFKYKPRGIKIGTAISTITIIGYILNKKRLFKK